MRTVLIGLGSIGGTVAAMAYVGGHEIDVVVNGEEKAAEIREKGFTLTGANGEHNVKMNTFGSIAALEGKYDVCIIATKYQQMPSIACQMLPYLNDDSLVVCMQNGIQVRQLAEVVGEERAVGIMIGFGATRKSNTEVEMTSLGEFFIGMLGGRKPEKLSYVKELLSCCLPTEIDDDIEARLYSKLIINSCINSLAGITGKPLGQLVDEYTACQVFLEITREAMRTAKKMGMKVPKYGKLLEYRMLMLMDNAVYNFWCAMVVKMVSKAKYKDVKPSTLQSLEAGQKTEIDIMNGLISAYGKANGVPTPVNDRLTQMIKEIENGEREISMENLKEFKK